MVGELGPEVEGEGGVDGHPSVAGELGPEVEGEGGEDGPPHAAVGAGLVRGGWEGGGRLEEADPGDSLRPFGLVGRAADEWVAVPGGVGAAEVGRKEEVLRFVAAGVCWVGVGLVGGDWPEVHSMVVLP